MKVEGCKMLFRTIDDPEASFQAGVEDLELQYLKHLRVANTVFFLENFAAKQLGSIA